MLDNLRKNHTPLWLAFIITELSQSLKNKPTLFHLKHKLFEMFIYIKPGFEVRFNFYDPMNLHCKSVGVWVPQIFYLKTFKTSL